MEKFTDRLEKWVQERDKKQKKKRQDIFTVEFLTVKNDISEAIEAGYSLKTIWEYLKEGGKVQSTYETFRRHVKRFIKTIKNEDKTSKENKKQQLPGSASFKFDAKPNKEDLI